MYWAFQEKAYVNDRPVKDFPSIRSLNECVFDAGLYTLNKHPGLMELYHKTRGHRCYGCASLSIIKVALGKLDFYCSEHAKCWDYAGGVIFLEACKGCYWISKDFFTCEPCLVLVARGRTPFVKSTQVLRQLEKELSAAGLLVPEGSGGEGAL